MKLKEVGEESVNALYRSWKNTKGRYYPKMDKSEFIHRYFDDPVGKSRCFLVEKRLGAFLLRSYGNHHLMYDWLGSRETHIFEEVMGSIRSLNEIEGVISLFHYFGRDDYFEDWKREGFTADERAPYHILMRKEIQDEKEREKRRIEVEKLSTSKHERMEDLAAIIAEISPRFSKADMMEGLGWELEGDMDYYLALRDGKTVGYSGIEVRELFTGKTMYWIKELGVHPEERRKGIATDLLKHTTSIVKEQGGKEIYIDTHSENPAKKLYEKHGFQVTEKLPNLRYEL